MGYTFRMAMSNIEASDMVYVVLLVDYNTKANIDMEIFIDIKDVDGAILLDLMRVGIGIDEATMDISLIRGIVHDRGIEEVIHKVRQGYVREDVIKGANVLISTGVEGKKVSKEVGAVHVEEDFLT